MMRNLATRCLAGALALLAGLTSLPAPAQTPAAPVVRVPCCRCVDGRVHVVNLNTRTAPWQVRRVSPPPTPLVPVVNANNAAWTTAAAPAGWVSHPTGSLPGVYVYELRIQVPSCMIRGRVTIDGLFSADNGGTLSLVRPGGSSIALGTRPLPNGFTGVTSIPVTAMTTPGTYILRATVTNLHGPSGYVFRGRILVRCPRDPALGPLSAVEQAEAEAVTTEE